MKQRTWTKFVLVLLGACLLVIVHETVGRLTDSYAQLDLLADVRHEILEGFVETPNEDKMVQAAVRGMVESLNDRYTTYLAPDETDMFEKHVHGRFSGIGAAVEIDTHQERLVIVSPLEESPAWESGVMAGDIVLEIDGEDTKGMEIGECVKHLTGPVGTQVTIKVRHPSDEDELITITRAQINIQTVKGFRRDADQQWQYMVDESNGVAYVRITQFTERTAENLRAALEQIVAQQARGLILDLRFNAGGLLTTAVEVSDMFLEAGKTIVSVKGRKVQEKVYRATAEGTVADIPMVVLANEWSASAAEIVTGALSDNERAQFVGMRTFGKGSVQQYKLILNNREQVQGGLKITNAYYYLPSGRNIHRREPKDDDDVDDVELDVDGDDVELDTEPEPKADDAESKDDWGVDPADGFFVTMTADQIKAMNKIRREGDILKDRAADAADTAVTPQWIEDELGDPQLAAALRAVLGKLADGQWPAVGQSGRELIIKQAERAALTRQRDMLRDHLEELEEKLAKLDDPQGAGADDTGAAARDDSDQAADAEQAADTPPADPATESVPEPAPEPATSP